MQNLEKCYHPYNLLQDMQFCIKDIEIRGTPLICIYQKFLFFFNLEYHLTSNTICHHPEMVVLRQWSNPYWHMGIRRMQCQRTKKELEMQQRIKNHKSMALRVKDCGRENQIKDHEQSQLLVGNVAIL